MLIAKVRCSHRNRRRRYGLRCNLMAALYNYELSLEVQSG